MKTKTIISILSCIILIPSCTEQIDIETTASESVIVIYGCITDKLEHQKIYLSRSAPYFQDTHNDKISGALVEVISGTNTIWEFEENPVEKGTYISKDEVKGIAGETYTLHVDCDFNKDGFIDQYSAITTMPTLFVADSVQINLTNKMGKNLYTANIYGEESDGKDYYCSRCYVNDSLASIKITRYWTFDDKLFDGEYIDGLLVYYFADSQERDNYDDDEADKLTFIGKGDKISVEMIRIERGYYNFLNQCREGENGESVFGGPPSNIISNISNGGVGYFTAFGSLKVESVVNE